MDRLTAILMGLIAVVLMAVTVSDLIPRTTGAIAVLSQCGMYAVLEVDSTGQVRRYDGPMSEEDQERIMALPEEARIGILVPCPTFVEPPIQ